jgi:fibronectin-binding autotransporter adhesin
VLQGAIVNRIFRLVWNQGRQRWDVAAEIAGTRRKSAGGADQVPQDGVHRPCATARSRTMTPTLLAVALLACAGSQVAWAVPPGQGGGGIPAQGGNSGNGGQSGDGTAGAAGSNGNGGSGSGGASGGTLFETLPNSAITFNGTWYSSGENGSNGASASEGSGGGGGGAAILMSSNAQVTTLSSTQIDGGNGGNGGTAQANQGGGGGGGGDGLIFAAGGTLTNAGTITGGAGGNGGDNIGVNVGGGGGGGGGAAVSGAGLTIYNSGTLAGGEGGVPGSYDELSGNPGTQGASVQFTGGANTLVLDSGSQIDGAVWVMTGATATVQANANTLSINGGLEIDGTATLDTQNYTLTVNGAVSGNGVLTKIGSGTLVLAGSSESGGVTVSAGTLQLGSGMGASFNGMMTMDNATVLATMANASLNGTAGTNAADYMGGGNLVYAGATGGTGNAAVTGTSFTVTNSGSIAGGNGGTGGGSSSDNVTLAGGEGGAGATGISGSAFTVTNTGLIRGGTGGTGGTAEGDNNTLEPAGSPHDDVGGAGGIAISGTNFSLTNNGNIVGGIGGTGGGVNGDNNTNSIGGAGGTGGVAIQGSGFSLINDDVIAGGNGGAGGTEIGLGNSSFTNGASGNGAVAIVATGNASIINSGTISGGTGTSGQQDAIDFSGGGNTLTLESSYTIVGNVISSSGNTAGGDTLVLGGAANSSFNVSQIVANNPGSYGSAPVYVGFENYVKTGTSTWTLTGVTVTNTNWDIQAGTLSIGSDSTLGGGTNVTLDGGTLETTAAFNTSRNVTLTSNGGTLQTDDDLTISSVVAGAGMLSKSGAGTLTLSGTNTYGGGTTVLSGVLSISSDTNLGAGGGAINLNGGTLENTAAFTTTRNIAVGNNGGALQTDDDLTVTGVISGSGALTKLGSGTLVLTGANAYTGGTTISAGVLEGDTSSLLGAITDNAALVFNQTNDGTYSSAIGGSGVLTKLGAGTLILSAANTYSGGTIISAGTLQGDTTSLQGNITNNAALIFNQISDGTYSGVVSGSGTLTKNGAGVLILDGASTYTGNTIVTAGTLEVGDANSPSASIGGDVAVDGGATLRGHGSIDGDVINDGIVWPGGSVGTLTINGNYTQNADGALSLDITPAGASQLLVNGNASVAGTLNLIFAPGTYSNTTLTLVKANALSGTFSTVNGTMPASFTDTLSYTGTSVELALAQPTTTTTPPPPPPVVRVAPLDGALYGNVMYAVNVTQQQTLTSVLNVALTPCDAQTPSMQNVTTCANGTWAQFTGGNLSLNGSSGLNSTGFGVLGGVDHAIGTAHLGVEGGANQLNGNDTVGGNGRVESVHLGIYADANAGPLVLSGTLDGEHSDYHIQRATGIGAATSTPDGNTLSAALQMAWPLQLNAWDVTPKLGMLYQHQQLDSFGESIASTNELAADFPVTGSRSTYTSLQPYLAAAMQRSFMAQGVTYLPQLSLGYRYDARNSSPVVNVTTQDGTLFALPADQQGRGMATVGARISAQAGASWNVYMDYEGLFASRLHDNALSVGFTKHF